MGGVRVMGWFARRREQRQQQRVDAVKALFEADPTKEWRGFQIAEELGMNAGQLYPMLAGLERDGWLVSRRGPVTVGNLRARIYRMASSAPTEELPR